MCIKKGQTPSKEFVYKSKVLVLKRPRNESSIIILPAGEGNAEVVNVLVKYFRRSCVQRNFYRFDKKEN